MPSSHSRRFVLVQLGQVFIAASLVVEKKIELVQQDPLDVGQPLLPVPFSML